MKTSIDGMQVTNIEIKPNCRKVHGRIGALEQAFKIIRQRYWETTRVEINKDATFNLCLTVDRDSLAKK